MNRIGIRSEQKRWDSRTTITPEVLLGANPALKIALQKESTRSLPYKVRIFSDKEYIEAAAASGVNLEVVESLDECQVIIGTKEFKEVFAHLTESENQRLRQSAAELGSLRSLTFDQNRRLIELTDFMLEEEKSTLQALAKKLRCEHVVNTLFRKQNTLMRPETAYVCFSHTHKGQIHNMRMLNEMIRKRCTLIDYELLKHQMNGTGLRSVAYSHWAGIVGALDTLWAYGEHVHLRAGIEHPFRRIRREPVFDTQNFEYRSLESIKTLLAEIGHSIKANGLPLPCRIGVSGFRGQAGGAVIELLETMGLPIVELPAHQLLTPTNIERLNQVRDTIFVFKFDYDDLYRAKSGQTLSPPEISKILKQGEGHHLESNFERYFPALSIFINCILWQSKNPRLLTNAYLKSLFDQALQGEVNMLPVIGDITCDPNGSIQCCRDTYPDHPAYLWQPMQTEEPILSDFDLKTAPDDFEYFDISGFGYVLMTVTNLPCEIPREASLRFSRDFCKRRHELAGSSYLDCLSTADFSKSFADCGLPQPMKDAVILYQGKFNSDNEQLCLKEICLGLIEIGAIEIESILPVVK